ncbi:hypothetical protein Rhe02_92290 [Rhizocola hellebori]|uniref:Uncharacterized protein n=1 Tax=Rhizocola hellebori TaxID=1392758 RepID=A0A8J3QJE3_9ACTN|nr:hypothetical protein [Rhizocola hellebori]GIH11162.1 hypothetical protein Rhe02_92290 [Rhizocola hellebori]
MSEDVIEFGPTGVPERQPKLRRLPQLPGGTALPTAAAGAIALIASMLGRWQSTTLPYDQDSSREVGSAIAALGAVGGAYVAVAVATVAAVVITLFGQPSVRHTARLLGYALAASGLTIVGTMAYSLTKTSNLAEFRLFPQEDLDRVHFTLEWGTYVAFAGMLALGASLILSVRPSPSSVRDVATAAAYQEPAEMELEVSVFPASPKTSPGAGHELYMRQ